MYKRNLFILLYFYFSFFTTIYGLSKRKVLRLKEGEYYCKDNNCVPTTNRIDPGTVIIPDKKGNNITYITDTCSILDINLDLCNSKGCTSDTQCLSNKCIKGHCSHHENSQDSPLVHCQVITAGYKNTRFFRFKKMKCGLPRGAQCNSDKECSSNVCSSTYYDKRNICKEPIDNGCRSLCTDDIVIGATIIYGPIIIFIIFICKFLHFHL